MLKFVKGLVSQHNGRFSASGEPTTVPGSTGGKLHRSKHWSLKKSSTKRNDKNGGSLRDTRLSKSEDLLAKITLAENNNTGKTKCPSNSYTCSLANGSRLIEIDRKFSSSESDLSLVGSSRHTSDSSAGPVGPYALNPHKYLTTTNSLPGSPARAAATAGYHRKSSPLEKQCSFPPFHPHLRNAQRLSKSTSIFKDGSVIICCIPELQRWAKSCLIGEFTRSGITSFIASPEQLTPDIPQSTVVLLVLSSSMTSTLQHVVLTRRQLVSALDKRLILLVKDTNAFVKCQEDMHLLDVVRSGYLLDWRFGQEVVCVLSAISIIREQLHHRNSPERRLLKHIGSSDSLLTGTIEGDVNIWCGQKDLPWVHEYLTDQLDKLDWTWCIECYHSPSFLKKYPKSRSKVMLVLTQAFLKMFHDDELSEALTCADLPLVVLLKEWQAYDQLDSDAVAILNTSWIIDSRHVFNWRIIQSALLPWDTPGQYS